MENNGLKDSNLSSEDKRAVFNVLGHALDPTSGDFDGDLTTLAARVTGLDADDPAQAKRLAQITQSIDGALEQAVATEASLDEEDIPEAVSEPVPDVEEDPLEAAIAEPYVDTFEEEALSELNAVLGMCDDVLPETLARKKSA